MFISDTLADKASTILFEKTEERLKALLGQQGVSGPGELPRSLQAELLRRAVVEAAAVNFPTANLKQLDHGGRSFAHPAFIPAWERVRALTAIGSGALAMASGADAAVLLARFGLPVAPL